METETDGVALISASHPANTKPKRPTKTAKRKPTKKKAAKRKVPKTKSKARKAKTKRPTKTAKRKPAKKAKPSRAVVRMERLDMRLSKAEKAKVVAVAKRRKQTITVVVYEAIARLK